MTATDRQAFDPETGALHDINWWAKLYFDMSVFPWQAFFYHYPAKDKMVVAGIRVGKSKGATMGQLHFGQYHPSVRVLNTSISSEQAKIVYHNMMELVSQERFKHWVEHTERSPYPMIKLVNGTEFWFRSVGYEAELLRGFEFDVIHVDEAAYITNEMVINTLKGRLLGVNPITHLPRAGQMWYSTSPKGKAGWVYERWKKGDIRFPGADPKRQLSLRVRTIDNPLLDKDALQELMRDYTDRMIAQELEGEFLDDTSAEFDMDEIVACCDEHDHVVRQLNEGIEIWRSRRGKKRSLKLDLGMAEEIDHFEIDPKPGRQYMASWDLGKKATKSGRNATVGMVFDITELPWRMVAYRYEEGTNYLPAMVWIEEWHRKYSVGGTTCQTIIDATGKGDVVNEAIELENRIHIEGMVYNSVLKPNLITAGKIALERQMVRYPFIKRFVDQLSIYTQNDKDLPQDTVMAFCQLMYRAREFTGVGSKSSLTPRIYRRSASPEPHERRMMARRQGSLRTRSRRVS